jgi:hypothetical protein
MTLELKTIVLVSKQEWAFRRHLSVSRPTAT